MKTYVIIGLSSFGRYWPPVVRVRCQHSPHRGDSAVNGRVVCGHTRDSTSLEKLDGLTTIHGGFIDEHRQPRQAAGIYVDLRNKAREGDARRDLAEP